MEITHKIAARLGIHPEQVSAAVELFDAGNTIPFIARYRKEATRGLDEDQLRQLSDLLQQMRDLDERRHTVLKSIDAQGMLTSELQRQIDAAETMTALEDLYLPFKPKRRTRAGNARERGLQPLADLILEQARLAAGLAALAAPFLNDAVPDADQAWAGARDIVAETISDHAEVRRVTREKALHWGTVASAVVEDAADEKRLYELYYAFEMRVDRLKPHQILALNRGEAEKVLRVRVIVPERDWRGAIEAVFRPDPRSSLAQQLEVAAADAAERLLLPAIERDVRRVLTEHAERHAIGIFADNLKALLSQPPLEGHTILGIDPGFRTGCKVAVVDSTGKLLAVTTIYPHEPQRRWTESLAQLSTLLRQHHVTLVAIGNGTASRETEQLAAELIRGLKDAREAHAHPVTQYLIVSEAGASVYSASPLARAELPELDVSLRGAVSIARRAQDPLAELVKIDPKSIGVGLYQHDVDQKQLDRALAGVVEGVVNSVGVDLNTASPALLAHVVGIGPKLAEKIVEHRQEKGAFPDRQALRTIPGLGPKAFEQAAGFLRVHGAQPLDASAIHPESYPIAEKVLQKAGLQADTPPQERSTALGELIERESIVELAAELGTGTPTLSDILEQLVRPGRDPRREAPPPLLRSDVLKIDDLVIGMRLKGTVRNVVDFGAFIDIGVKGDGLLHRSRIPAGAVIKVGDILDVEIQKVEIDRGRIALAWVN